MSKSQTNKTKSTQWTVLTRAGWSRNLLQTKIGSNSGDERQRVDFKTILTHVLIVSLVAGLIYSESIGFSFNFVDSYITGPFASKLRETNFWNELFLQSL
jgi:hypothetical protein